MKLRAARPDRLGHGLNREPSLSGDGGSHVCFGPEREGRVENERAWKVSIDEIRKRGFNLDIKNPRVEAEDWGDPETLLNDLTKAEASVDSLRAELKSILTEALAP